MKKSIIFILSERSFFGCALPLVKLGGISLLERSLKLAKVHGYAEVEVFCSAKVKSQIEGLVDRLDFQLKDLEGVEAILPKPKQTIVFGDYYFEHKQVDKYVDSHNYCVRFNETPSDLESQPQRTVWLNNTGTLFSKFSNLKESTKVESDILSYEAIFMEDEVALSLSDRKKLRVYEKSMFDGLAKASDAFTARHLNRKISLAISKQLIKTPITPNQITLLILTMSLSIPYFLNKGTYLGFLAGAFMYQVSSVLDGCDGEIARIKLTYSKFGAWLDTVCDHVTHVLFFIGLGFGTYSKTGSYEGLLISFLLLLTFGAILLLIFEEAKKLGSFGVLEDEYLKSKDGKQTWWSGMTDIVKPFGQRANYTMIILIMALFGVLPYVLYIGLSLAVIIFLYALLFISKGKALSKVDP